MTSNESNESNEGNEVRALLATMSEDEVRALLATFAPSREGGAPSSRESVTRVLARDLTCEGEEGNRIAREEDEVRPLLTLASSSCDFACEVREDEEGNVRVRMRCACSRSSYLAPSPSHDVIPHVVVVALSRHIRRARGRALRVVRSSPSLVASLLVTSEGTTREEAHEAIVAHNAHDEGDEGETFARVSARGGRGATTHLTRDALTTLCERDATNMSEDTREDTTTCRACESASHDE